MKKKFFCQIFLLIFAIIVSCTPLPTPAFDSNYSSTPMAEQQNNPNNSVLKITGEKVFGNSRLSAEFNNQIYSVIPSECWTVKDDPLYTSLPSSQAESAQIQFIIVSSKASVISEITLILDEYLPSPSYNKFSELYLNRSQPGGPLTSITLGDALLNPDTIKSDLANLDAYQLNEQDAIRFQVWTTFSQPGLYKFHIEVTANAFEDKNVILKSKPLQMGWVLHDNLEKSKVFDVFTREMLTLIRCK